MVTQFLVHTFTVVTSFLLGLLPAFSLPSWVSEIGTWVSTGLVNVAQLGHWIALDAIALAAALIGGAWATAFAIRGARIVASFFTGGGGNAA